MLSLPPTVRIWPSIRPADLRKSFDGLAVLVRDGPRGDPLSGDIFVLRNKPADRIKHDTARAQSRIKTVLNIATL